MAMDRDEMVDFLFGTLGRVMRRHKSALARREAEERGIFDDEDDEDDDDLIALAHLRSQEGQAAGSGPAPHVAPPGPENDLIARARAELAALRQREELARLNAEIRRQRQATAAAEAHAAQEGSEELTRLRAEIDAQRTRTAAAEATVIDAPSAAADAGRDASATVAEPAAQVDDTKAEDRLAAVEAMGELTLKALAVMDDDSDDDGDDDDDSDNETADADAVDLDDDDPVEAHPLLLGQRALRRGDPRAALDHFQSVIDEMRPAHRRAPKDATIAVGLCQSLRAAATARLGLADFPAAIRDINEAVDVAIALHQKAPSAEALTEVAASLCDKVEVLLAVGDRQGAAMLAGEGVRVLKRGLRRHTSRPAIALFERLRSLRAALTRRQVG